MRVVVVVVVVVYEIGRGNAKEEFATAKNLGLRSVKVLCRC